MQLIESASAKRTNPSTLKVGSCMIYNFDTGHQYCKWSDGIEFFHNKAGRALNRKSGHKLVAEMKELAAKGIV